MSHLRPRLLAVLLMVGAALAIAFWQSARGPHWILREQNQGYAYLFSALGAADKGEIRQVMFHPGVPVTYLSALYLKATGKTPTQIFQSPEDALERISSILRLVLVGLFGALVSVVLKKQKITAAHLFLALPFLSPIILDASVYISAESFLLIFTMLLFLLCELTFRGKAVALGVVCGLGMATKLTFMPLVAFPFLWLPSRRERVTLVLTMGMIFSVHLVWLSKDLPQIAGFLRSVLTHRPDPQFPYAQESIANAPQFFWTLVRENPAVLLLCLSALIPRSPVFASALLGFLMLLIKPTEPYYAAPLLLLLIPMAGLLTETIRWRVQEITPAMAALAGLVFLQGASRLEADTQSRLLTASCAGKLPHVIRCNPVSSPDFALMKGNYYQKRYDPELRALYPDSLFCNLTDGSLGNWDRPVTVSDIKQAMNVYVQAPRHSDTRLSELFGAPVTPHCGSGGETVYQVSK